MVYDDYIDDNRMYTSPLGCIKGGWMVDGYEL